MMEVSDDSGFLALVVPAAYPGFVDSDWNLKQLFNHFRYQVARRSMLIWGTGLENFWKVDVRLEASGVTGFREIRGGLVVTGGEVLVTNYESLAMVAQCAEVRLPQPHETDQLVRLSDGKYVCRIVQMLDPRDEELFEDHAEADFVVELIRSEDLPAAWPSIPWFK